MVKFVIIFGLLKNFETGICGEIAQLVEQWPEEPRVLGSIPSLATTRV